MIYTFCGLNNISISNRAIYKWELYMNCYACNLLENISILDTNFLVVGTLSLTLNGIFHCVFRIKDFIIVVAVLVIIVVHPYPLWPPTLPLDPTIINNATTSPTASRQISTQTLSLCCINCGCILELDNFSRLGNFRIFEIQWFRSIVSSTCCSTRLHQTYLVCGNVRLFVRSLARRLYE